MIDKAIKSLIKVKSTASGSIRTLDTIRKFCRKLTICPGLGTSRFRALAGLNLESAAYSLEEIITMVEIFCELLSNPETVGDDHRKLHSELREFGNKAAQDVKIFRYLIMQLYRFAYTEYSEHTMSVQDWEELMTMITHVEYEIEVVRKNIEHLSKYRKNVTGRRSKLYRLMKLSRRGA